MFASNTSQASSDAVFIEDTFSTTLYTGNGSTQTITNGIDLAGKGGLVWAKARTAALDHVLTDTVRGATKELYSDLTNAQSTNASGLSSFSSSGFSVGGLSEWNNSGAIYTSWTFRKQPKFFDVVTINHTNGTADNINLSGLGTVGCVIAKITTTTGDWTVWHRSLTAGNNIQLNTTAAQSTTNAWLSVSGTTATLAAAAPTGTYVVYAFAHDAGGFGLTGTDNVISCGSFTTDGSGNATVNLGYEPQLVIIKTTGVASNWAIFDTMRGMPASGSDNRLFPNLSAAEDTGFGGIAPTATGFNGLGLSGYGLGASLDYIYIAIRRGPMKVPTDGTKVFLPTTYASPGLNVQSTVTTNFPIDLNICGARGANGGYTYKFWFTDRLRVSSGTSTSNSLLTAGAGGTPAETTYNGLATFYFDRMTSYQITDSNGSFNGRSAGELTFGYDLRRAPGFFDEVCYSGLVAVNNTTPQAVAHNLGVSPELVIVKCRNTATVGSTATNWVVCTILGGTYSNRGYLNTDDVFSFSNNLTPANGGSVSASNITFGYGDARTNASGNNYVAYLFASCPGVSKVGSFTGNGSSQTINCGFTGGARFVLIKRTDAAGQWYVWDSARGIVPGNDPYLSFSNSQSEDFNGASDSVDADASGFIVNQDTVTNSNVNGASYIYLAIA